MVCGRGARIATPRSILVVCLAAGVSIMRSFLSRSLGLRRPGPSRLGKARSRSEHHLRLLQPPLGSRSLVLDHQPGDQGCCNGSRSRVAVVDEGTGFGVDSGFLDDVKGTDDEVNGVEILTITLPTATTLAGFTVTNLYYESLLGLGSPRTRKSATTSSATARGRRSRHPRRTRPIPPGSCTSASRPSARVDHRVWL